jgi:hypothetical protein
MIAFKLDENVSPHCRAPLTDAGCDVSTVGEQRLRGADDSGWSPTHAGGSGAA